MYVYVLYTQIVYLIGKLSIFVFAILNRLMLLKQQSEIGGCAATASDKRDIT